jgi:hypothetical protein
LTPAEAIYAVNALTIWFMFSVWWACFVVLVVTLWRRVF